MLRLSKHVVLVVLFVIAAGCSGGGCSSGCSCGGISPLPEGFKPEQRIENAASLRVTQGGVQFLQDNIGQLATAILGMGNMGVITFDVPKSSGSFGPLKYEVCPGGPKPNANPPECVAEIDLGNAKLKLDPQNPHNLKITGPLPVRLRKLPLKLTYFCVPIIGCVESNVDITLTGNKSCPGGAQPYAGIDLNVDVLISIDPNMQHSRYGYSKVKVNVDFDKNKLSSSLKVCGGFDAAILDAILGLAAGQITGPLVGTLQKQIDQQLCQKANDKLNPPCPAGTQNVGGICRYGSDSNAECASIVLGTEGHIDLGRFLQGISGGATGAFDFLLAAGGHDKRDDNTGEHWGDLNPIGKGITLGMYGGTEPAPPSDCVPRVPSQLPTGIPIPDEILANTIPDWPMATPGPHIGVALSERFANYALEQVYNSGALCLGITGDALGTPITSTLLGLGLKANSMVELGRMKQPQSMAFLLRPQKPPTIVFGNGTDLEKDPLLDIHLNGLQIDFYIWSLDRYIRAMTITTDLEVPANLTVTPDGLTPVIKTIKLANTSVSNAELLRDDPQKIAAALEGLVGSLLGGAIGGAFKPIDLNKQLDKLGIKLIIPETVDGKGSPGLRKLTKGSDNFLGIFAGLGLANMPPKMMSGTGAELTGFDVDPAGLRYDTMTPTNGPRARIRLSSTADDGTQAVEWQYRIDKQPWTPFSRARDLELEDPVLRNQGVHKVWIRSRIVGEPMSLDPEPKLIELRIDDMAPEIKLVREADHTLRVEAYDLVSGDQVQVRVRLGVGASADDASWGDWSTWQPATEIAAFPYQEATLVQVEAKDEGENVGTVTQALIRGQGTGGTGCQCTLEPGARPTSLLGWLAGAIAVGGVALRRRKRAARGLMKGAGMAAFLVLLGSAPGCSCSGDAQVPTADDCRGRGDCQVIEPGLIGAYSSIAVSPAGQTWVAGYLEANWDPAVNIGFGDLVVGAVDAKGNALWRVVDGTAADEVVDPQVHDPKGFRDGKTESGDDVGLWTSIALDAAGNPGVAYYDITHHALKYAYLSEGAWRTTTVQSGPKGSDYGLYAKLNFIGGKPVIAFHYVEANNDKVVSGVRLGTGGDAAGSAWSFENVVADDATPCKPALCASGKACVVTGSCSPVLSSCGDCGNGKACVDDGLGNVGCVKTKDGGANGTYPAENGLYIATAIGADGALRIGYYDRPKGNVMLATKAGGMWSSLLVDGADAMKDTGDKGIGLSIALDPSGNVHMSYVDGLSEGLDYCFVEGGSTPHPAEVVDTGLGANDGHHVVGDDSNIVVTQAGEVKISYQDATTGRLQIATGTVNGGTHAWKVQSVMQDGFAGAFSKQLLDGGQYKVLNWYRVGKPQTAGDIRIVTP